MQPAEHGQLEWQVLQTAAVDNQHSQTDQLAHPSWQMSQWVLGEVELFQRCTVLQGSRDIGEVIAGQVQHDKGGRDGQEDWLEDVDDTRSDVGQKEVRDTCSVSYALDSFDLPSRDSMKLWVIPSIPPIAFNEATLKILSLPLSTKATASGVCGASWSSRSHAA